MKTEENEKISYYVEVLPALLEQLEEMIDNNLDVVARKISPLLPDHKLKIALESRKMAVEDAIWAAKEVDKINMVRQGFTESQQDEYFEQSCYRRMIPRLVKELKGMVDNSMEIIGKSLDGLMDDKLKQGLISRRISADDSVWASKMVDSLEKELTGKTKASVREELNLSWVKRKAVQ